MEKKQSVDIVIPVYNEALELEERIETLHRFLSTNVDTYTWNIIIADNASTDETVEKAKKLAHTLSSVAVLHLDEKGRGRALKYAWGKSKADIVAYMDVDLSTDLQHLPHLLDSLSRGYEIGIASRNLRESRVYGRGWFRTLTSKTYIGLIKLTFFVRFSDAQCGCKVMSKKMVEELLPLIEDNEWFFDTELLINAEKLGYRIYEEPVTWIDNPGSTVRVMKTITGDLKGLWRLWTQKPWKRSK